MTSSTTYRRFLAAMHELARAAFQQLPLEQRLAYVERALAYGMPGAEPLARRVIRELPPERRPAVLARLIASGHAATRRVAVDLLAASQGRGPGTG